MPFNLTAGSFFNLDSKSTLFSTIWWWTFLVCGTFTAHKMSVVINWVEDKKFLFIHSFWRAFITWSITFFPSCGKWIKKYILHSCALIDWLPMVIIVNTAPALIAYDRDISSICTYLTDQLLDRFFFVFKIHFHPISICNTTHKK